MAEQEKKEQILFTIDNELLVKKFCKYFPEFEYEEYKYLDEKDLRSEMVEYLYCDAFNLCGCGSPELVWYLIRDLLTTILLTRDDRIFNRMNVIGPTTTLDLYDAICGNERSTMMALHLLDSLDLLEHGSSAYSSWLSDKGAIVLALAHQIKFDDEKDAPYISPAIVEKMISSRAEICAEVDDKAVITFHTKK